MNVVSTLKSDLVAAQKARDAVKVATLRLMISELTNKRIALGHDLTDEEAIAVLKTEVKKRKEAIEQFRAGAREDLAKNDEAQVAIIDAYLPAMMPEAEVEKIIRQLVTPDLLMKDMGTVMGKAMSQLKGKADGAVVNATVKKLLSENGK
jgi:uncharacterized protein YqeY